MKLTLKTASVAWESVFDLTLQDINLRSINTGEQYRRVHCVFLFKMAYFWCVLGALLLAGIAEGFTGIRLRGGKHRFEGRVEVLRNGEWRSVCDHGWNKFAANVVCRMLGFPGALRYYKG